MWRADLPRDAPPCLVIAFDRSKTFAQPLFGQVLEGARDLLGAVLLVSASSS